MLRVKVPVGQLAAAQRTSARAFSKSAILLQKEQEQEQEHKHEQEPKKSHKFRNFVLFTTSAALTAYGGGVYYSMKNDQFHDFFTEYVPFSENVVAWVEERQFRTKYAGQLSLPELKKHKTEDDKIIKVGPSGARPHDVSEVPDSPTKLPHVSAIEAKQKAEKAVKPQDDSPQTPIKTKKEKRELPLVNLPADADPLVSQAVESLNQFIHSVNGSIPTNDSIKAISNNLTQLSHKVHSIKSSHQEELKKNLEEQAQRFKQLGEARQQDLQQAVAQREEQLSEQFHKEQQRIIDLYNQRLVAEIEATKKTVLTHANNKLLAVNAERERQFAEQIEQRVEQERDGRLSKIQELAQSVEQLQQLSLSADKIIDESQEAASLQAALTALAHELKTAEIPTPLGRYLAKVKQCGANDDLIQATLDAVPDSVWTQGVLSNAQLAARLRLLAPEIRKASLLPPNAGIAGHIGSYLFSTFMWQKQGNPEGNDIESILARAESALGEGRATDAVSEINQLKGWPKRLAHDWLQEGRKRSEVEFLVDVLNQEGRVKSLK